MTVRYSGLNRTAGGTITDIEHIRQSVTDILTTPKGARVMRRTYGSDVTDLLDGPLNPMMKLRIMSAVCSALAAWEPRITVSAVTVQAQQGGAQVTVSAYSQEGAPLSITTQVTRRPSA